MSDNIEIAKNCFRAYADSDRELIEKLIADDFHFTSPYDNRIDRKTYFDRCWPNHKAIQAMTIVGAIENNNAVVITYEGENHNGKVFCNTEVFTIEDGKVVEVEVYFGWNLPHAAKVGGFVNPE